MAISTDSIQELRRQTGAGIMDAKRALHEAQGDLEKAVELLRRNGRKIAAGKQHRESREGVIGAYVHANGKVAALVELTCETDFVARTEEFHALAHDLALHVAALDPLYLDATSIPGDVVEKERSIALDLLEREGKPRAILEKIISGKLQKFVSEVSLLEQPFVKDETVTIRSLLEGAMQKFGENIQIRRFVRFQL